MDDWGDYAADTDEESEVQCSAEFGGAYLQGIYAPVRLGDVLDGRYQIIHKLGFGGFGTVWMAYDRQAERDVALKIMRSGNAAENEYYIQTLIKREMRDHSGLVVYQRSFFVDGNFGQKHRVLVLPMVGPSLNSALKERPMPARQFAARQLLKSLARLHAAGIVVNDLNSGSVMWGMESLAHYDLKTKYGILGRPLKDHAPWDSRSHQRQGELVRSMTVPESLLKATIYLGDFGMAFLDVEKPEHYVVRPIAFCAPERLHGVPPGPASDMWSYMCILSQLFFGYHPFTNMWSPSELIAHLPKVFGPLPPEWRGHYMENGTVSDSSYGPSQSYPPRFQRIISESNISASKRSHLVSVLSRGFQYRPKERMTAAQLLEDPSFRALTATP